MQVYFRYDIHTEDEFLRCSEKFSTVRFRTKLTPKTGESVICRYSALPFYRELEMDLNEIGLSPINSFHEHTYIANMDWVYDLEDMTFPTWFRLEEVPKDIPLVIKGRTNSRKFEWNSKMYSDSWDKTVDISSELMNDPLIGPQGLAFRKFEKLVTYEIGINGMPMTNEWRVFFYRGDVVDYDFYWSIMEQNERMGRDEFKKTGLRFAIDAATKIDVPFMVIDVAQRIDGSWVVVEVNDGQMSGLSNIPAERFYENLKMVVDKHSD